MWDQSVQDLFWRGGPVMWPLLAASVIGLALILDRALVFLWSHQDFDALVQALRPLVREGKWAQAEQFCRRRGPLSQLARVYLEQRAQPAKVREDIVEREGKLILRRLESRVRWLAIDGQLSPMLGLLGTVTGLVGAFHQVEKLGGQVQPSDLASGIWEALLTTVFGLVIAIPCMAAYHLFEGRTDTIAQQMTLLVSYLDQWCLEAAETTASAGDGKGNSSLAHRATQGQR